MVPPNARVWNLTEWEVAAACADEVHAREAIFERSRPFLVQLAMAYLASGPGAMHLAEDIVQDAQLGLWKGLARIERTVGGFKRYAHGVVKNLVIDALHDKRRRRPLEDDHRRAGQMLSGFGSESSFMGRIAADQAGPRTTVEQADSALRAMVAIGGLDELDQEIMILFYFEGLSTTEIAEQLGAGTTRSKVGMRITRGLRKMNQMMTRGEEGVEKGAE